MGTKLETYLDVIINDGLEKNYWFMTKQTMTDFYFFITIARVVATYKSNHFDSENFGSYYQRYFNEHEDLKEKFPKQAESENTYRNAIIAEFFGLFYREKVGYDTGVVTPAFNVINKYITTSDDLIKYKFLIERQIEKLCLNVNEKIQNFNDLDKVKNFPVIYLYKILLELYKRTGDSKLYYDEFVVFLVRALKYSDWKDTMDLILEYREGKLSPQYQAKYDQIYNDVTAKNIRFDALLGILTNINYVTRVERNYYSIKDDYDSYRYIENVIEIFEASKYSSETITRTELRQFLQSEKYFLGFLDVAFVKDKKEEDKMIPQIDESKRIKGGENIILYGVPGAGKSYTIGNDYCKDEKYMKRLVFHPDYTYSDFVGQILPILNDDMVRYVFTPGPFTQIVRDAYRDPEHMYFLVVEEVNRGNAPAIFGDIFQLLDRNKKSGASEYQITNSDIATIVYGDSNHKVSIPSNMSILCTMNTSDQNVFTLDTAFQRRWSMRLIPNKFSVNDTDEQKLANTKILDTDVTWEKFFGAINDLILKKNIRMTSSEDKRLGTHFVSISDLIYEKDNERQNSKFAEKVLKYLWDDAFKFNKDELFDLSKVNSLEKVIDNFVTNEGNTRFVEIFKQNIYDAILPKKQ